MQSAATTPAEYIAELPEDRRPLVKAIRATIRKHLPKGYKEGMQYGMLGYFVPHSKYPAGYHCDPKQPVPFAGVGNQKNHVGLYLFCTYCDPSAKQKFVDSWKATGKKLDMGKACVRVKTMDDVPFEVLGASIADMPMDRFLAIYEGSIRR
ncbi:MAG: DUF1801 domain-containing protein [Planctomycetota bacterium]